MKGFIINTSEQEIVINISQIENVLNETVQFAGGLTLGKYDIQTINEIKVAVEAYSPGVSPEVIEELERQISDLNDQIAVLDTQIETLNSQINDLETENTALIAQRDTLIAQKEQLEAQVAALTAEVELAYQRGYEDGYNAAGGDWHSNNPLCFTAEQANSTIKTANDRLSSPEISYNGTDWEEYTEGTTITLTNIGDKVYFRSKLTTYSGSTAFTMTGKIAASGNPESLHEVTKGELYSYCYYKMFYNCQKLTKAPELPATTLANSCYQYMFYGCTSLTTAPELPATELGRLCYNSMFYGCTSLTTAPELPATELGRLCYEFMFQGCTSLTQAPELPATTLADSCYNYMFSGCTSLTTAPELPANTLASSCYYSMFYGCSNLNYIKVGATSWSTSYASSWVTGVSATGTFVKPEVTTIPTGTSGIPSGWTVETY